MKNYALLFSLALTLGFTSCKNENKDKETDETMTTDATEVQEEAPVSKKLTISLDSKSGSTATGNVVFTEEDGEVSMTAVFEGLEPGMHAIHIHENADCSADDGTSAGGHWNPTKEQHGKWGDAEGYHKGDIGNFEADDNGNGTITMATDEWCIDCEDATKNIVGKGVIVHQGADDFTSQPSGAAGARVSCGGIIQ
ncbi:MULTISPECIES: superoxide dismutase family protein [Leeuwenhoekiella]|nr:MULTISPECIES: superoxide dismutase family protein [Leeuwenhoekiella]MAS19767.1 superoxide dismutase family protein [Leeuwenhoekiella sp.]MEC7784492.1 superoxide dismutase family protein [Bacteroidota bacterium]MBH11311.1 superoxide dismutase family protein [Leeuwenhoekiella sp.]MEC8683667.1 superoxide dismutase family protein [Bacteroidota bacterium]MEE3147044.1 superoxide dismutase family protein [Bacteroidota bacterium]|tara:strand:+ start:691 stop:1278 length:588 start_codon:yes stop_codon:yes gene_type:complete